MNQETANRNGPSWLAIIFAAVVVAGVILVMLAYHAIVYDSRRLFGRDVLNQRAVAMSLKTYAAEHDGNFPSGRLEEGEFIPFTHSTGAFRLLLERDYTYLNESIFYVYGNPGKPQPILDGDLQQRENCMIYVTGQHDGMDLNSPLTADEMVTPGVYGKGHPWFKFGAAVVSYVGGHAKAERLTQKTPGATVTGLNEIQDIFQPIEAGGLMAVPRENILLP